METLPLTVGNVSPSSLFASVYQGTLSVPAYQLPVTRRRTRQTCRRCLAAARTRASIWKYLRSVLKEPGHGVYQSHPEVPPDSDDNLLLHVVSVLPN
jgi:hypothetical protein